MDFRLWPTSVRIARTLPGELIGEVNPEDYGFGVIREEPPDEAEAAIRVGALAAQILERRPDVNLKSKVFMRYVDFAPAEALRAKHAELSYPYHCTFGGAELEIDEGVFCPTLTSASPFLLEAINKDMGGPGDRVLDAFAGSGAFGVIAARHGAEVVTVDTSLGAVICTAKNADRNRVAERVDARHGTIQTTLSASEKFDLIIANPPLLPGEPSDELSAAVFDPDLQATVDFVAALPVHLAENGRCYLLTSNVLFRFGCDLERLCRDHALRPERVAYKIHSHEDYRVHKITR